MLAAGGIVDGVEFDFRVPDFVGAGGEFLAGLEAHGGQLCDADGIQAFKDGEHAGHDVFLLVVGAEGVAIEAADFLAHLGEEVHGIPGVELGGGATGAVRDEIEQGIDFTVEVGFDFVHHAVDKGEGGIAAADHAAGGSEVGVGYISNTNINPITTLNAIETIALTVSSVISRVAINDNKMRMTFNQVKKL